MKLSKNLKVILCVQWLHNAGTLTTDYLDNKKTLNCENRL